MVKGFTRGSGNSRKFIPTRDIHRGLSKDQIAHGVEPPISAGNEMLQRKKEEFTSEECTRCKGQGTRNGVAFCYRCMGTGQKRKKESLDDGWYGLQVGGISTHHDSEADAIKYYKNFPKGTYQIGERRNKQTLEDGTKLTATQEATLSKLQNNEVLTESDVNHIKNSLNGSFSGSGEGMSSFADHVLEVMGENEDGYRLTPEQTQKGLAWLQKTRIQNKYLGEREREMLNDFDHFRLIDWVDEGNGGRSFYVPVYGVFATNGEYFSYHITGTGSSSAIEIDG